MAAEEPPAFIDAGDGCESKGVAGDEERGEVTHLLG